MCVCSAVGVQCRGWDGFLVLHMHLLLDCTTLPTPHSHPSLSHSSPTPYPHPSLSHSSPTPLTFPLLTHTPHRYLDTARCCDNPKCVGVYFEASVQAVKFSDFCGKYRIPFQHYLCSSNCTADLSSPSPSPSPLSSSGEQDEADPVAQLRMQKVLLG